MKVMLKLLLEDQHYLAIPMEGNEAQEIMEKWRSNHYKVKSISHLSGVIEGFAWCVDLERVLAMHTMPLQASQVQETGYSPYLGGGKVSGYG